MKTQVELLKECCDIKDAACVRYQKRIEELEKENKELKEYKENLIRADKKKTEYIDELEEKLKLTENDRDEREVKARDLMKKLKEIEKAYIEFEKAETEYNKKLGVLDKLIMIR